jgi:ribosomal protein S18 acetylase RimI-like enzyme
MNLKPMSRASFELYLERLIVEFAEDKVGAGNWSEEAALTRSRDEITKLLTDGLSTPGHALFDLTLPDEKEAVGVLWLSSIEDNGARQGFIYDVWIRPDLRRKGLGTTAMMEAERWARSQGLTSLGLHVFGHNQAALALYEKLGYVITNINMTKQLS